MAYPATYLRPESLDEALRLAQDPANVILAGGTLLQPLINEGNLSPSVIVDISAAPELSTISLDKGQLRIGATATLAEIAANEDVRRLAPILAEAVETIACAEVRQQATLGGNVEGGLPSMDSLPALLVLDADVELASVRARRRLPLGEHLGNGRTGRRADELLVAIEVPPQPRWAGRFTKLGLRKAFTPPVVSLAVQLHLREARRIAELRVAAGCCADRALRLTGVESAAIARDLDVRTIDELADLAAAEITPPDDLYRSAGYRRRALAELLRRTLQEMARPT